jgi:hypothetical protein
LLIAHRCNYLLEQGQNFLKKVFPLTPFQKLLFWGAFFRFLAAEIRKKAPQTPKERKRLGFGYLFVFNL